MDQVPLPIVISLDDNCDTKGSYGTVRFSQLGAGSEKRFFIRLCFCQRVIHPDIVVMFWGTGRIIADFDK